MSRGFKKEEAPEDPIVVPPRAPLPAGVPNYVTPRGERLLREEKAALEDERSALASGGMEETERKRQMTALGERLQLLMQRLAQTQVVDPSRQRPEVARFGARVVLAGGGRGRARLPDRRRGRGGCRQRPGGVYVADCAGGLGEGGGGCGGVGDGLWR